MSTITTATIGTRNTSAPVIEKLKKMKSMDRIRRTLEQACRETYSYSYDPDYDEDYDYDDY